MKVLRRTGRADRMKKKLAQNPGALFGDVLSKEDVDEQCRWLGHVWRERIFTPLVTLWTFLSQVLCADNSCKNAVARVLTFLARTVGLDASHDPSSYCTARQRLPRELLPRLSGLVAGRLAAKVKPEDLWHGHRVKLVDGSSVQMPDTQENQEAYPQPSCQKRGCGFPVARLVGLFDLLTGALVNLVLGALKVSETRLFRSLWDTLEAGDVVVADKLFCAYADLVLLLRRGVYGVFGLHAKRKLNFRKGKPLGRGDRLMVWEKGRRPDWMSKEEFAALPPTLSVRVLRFACPIPGWRAEQVIVVTTLLDPNVYPFRDVAELYFRRWNIETDLRHLKTTMKMEMLRTKSPDMVEREIWAHLLAYNLVRTLMWEAAQRRRVGPTTLSFKAAIQEMMALWPFTVTATRTHDLTRFYDSLLRILGTHKIPNRPGRTEPRVIKRRPKNYPVMGAPRPECRRSLIAMHS
jgi:IS4 transposase